MKSPNLLAAIGWALLAAPLWAAEPVDPAHAEKMARGLKLFQEQVGPLLKERCLYCHGGDATESGLNLATREGLLRGGERGKAVVVGQASESLLVKVIRYQAEPNMPEDTAKLKDEEIAAIAKWIDLGAPYEKPLIDPETAPVDWRERQVPAAARNWWSFQPLASVEPPAAGHGWARGPIDRFVAARHAEQELTAAPEADRRTLIRRVYLDVLGLPPTPEQVDAFTSDPRPDAYERMVDRVLADPGYGERWGRHWLDVARFAESHGFEQDYNRDFAFHYRDFVIAALNEDMPYDQFVRWQLAGDELAPDNPWAMKATGFLGAGVFPTQITKNEVERTRYDALDDMAATTGTAMLGLTIGCARCHDHKFDPLPQADYYRFVSIFTTTVRSNIELPRRESLHSGQLERWTARKQELETQLASAGEDVARRKAIEQQLAAHAKRKPPAVEQVMVASEGYQPIRHHTQGADFFNETYFLRRGDCEQKDGVAEPDYPQVLLRDGATAADFAEPRPEGWRTSYRRRGLANWIVDLDRGAGPLAARVAANRLWQHHYHRGIVATPNDFGTQGEPPTHPRLLEWLAGELVRGGWRLKPLHRQILTSATYRQSAAVDSASFRADPENRCFWRRQPERLEAEIIRDSALAVSGLLDRRMYGAGTLDPRHLRRSIYFMVKRSRLVPAMTLFDSPEPLVSVGNRPATTIAPQALHLMNNEQVRRRAAALADRAAKEADDDLAATIARAYRLALARGPQPRELQAAAGFIERQTQVYQQEASVAAAVARQRAVTDFAQTLLCLNEFIYVD